MSCGRTPTRRQVHGHKRIVIVGKHRVQQGGHKSGKPPAPKPHGHKRIVITHPLPKPKQKITKKQLKQKVQPKSKRRKLPAWLVAWEKKHPFKNHRMTRQQLKQWEKKHPFKHGGHTRKAGVTHKVICHVKTRHAVKTSRHKKGHKRIVITRPLNKTAVKASRAQRAQRAMKAR